MKIQNASPNPSRNKKRQAPRADFHDYKAPGYYHITITAYEGTPRLSDIPMPSETILRRRDMIIPDNTELGECVKNEMLAMTKKQSEIADKAIRHNARSYPFCASCDLLS